MSKKYYYSIFSLLFIITLYKPVYAMHIMEGFLSPLWCGVWFVASLPFIIIGTKKLSKTVEKNNRAIIILAMAGAFSFLLSALKIPSVTGSSSHMTGLGFSAILFGPFISSILGLIVLLFQALFLAHGGLSTLGANVFSMGIFGPIITYLIFSILSKNKVNNKVSIFLAASLGDLATYVLTSFQLAIAFPSEVGGFVASLTKFMTIFSVTQIPLAIAEGLLTVVLFNVIGLYGKNILLSTEKEEFLYE